MTAASSPEDSGTVERWGDFHLTNWVGHVYVSTMWDGRDRPEGPYETAVFHMGAEEVPLVHHQSREDATWEHNQIVDALERLQERSVL